MRGENHAAFEELLMEAVEQPDNAIKSKRGSQSIRHEYQKDEIFEGWEDRKMESRQLCSLNHCWSRVEFADERRFRGRRSRADGSIRPHSYDFSPTIAQKGITPTDLSPILNDIPILNRRIVVTEGSVLNKSFPVTESAVGVSFSQSRPWWRTFPSTGTIGNTTSLTTCLQLRRY